MAYISYEEDDMRSAYKLLSYVWIFKALKRGPAAFVRQRIRSHLIKHFARALRRVLKP